MRDFITQCELFSGLEPDAVDLVITRFREVSFTVDQVLCSEGDVGDNMFIITEGEVSVRKDLAWGERELQRLAAGEVVGEMSLLSNARRSATVVAVAATKCLEMNRSDFLDLLNKEPHIAQQAAIILTERLATLNKSTGDEIVAAYRAVMFSLADLADSRDPETGAHLDRTRSYCALLAELYISNAEYKGELGPAFVEGMYYVSPLHDIGKVAIPDRVLLKPGRLDKDEFTIMKNHTTIGADSLKGVLEYSDQEVFRMAYRICRFHHEKWDGSGYPDGLKGEEIPIEARIMMLADVYDALLSKRVYKPPMSFKETADELRSSFGTHFDPKLAKLMLDNIEQFEVIHQRIQQDERV